MKVYLRYSENKKKILANVKGHDLELAELVLAVMFGKEEQTIEALGDVAPEVIIDDVPDEKLTKESKKFIELLDKFYEDYWKRH